MKCFIAYSYASISERIIFQRTKSCTIERDNIFQILYALVHESGQQLPGIYIRSIMTAVDSLDYKNFDKKKLEELHIYSQLANYRFPVTEQAKDPIYIYVHKSPHSNPFSLGHNNLSKSKKKKQKIQKYKYIANIEC